MLKKKIRTMTITAIREWKGFIPKKKRERMQGVGIWSMIKQLVCKCMYFCWPGYCVRWEAFGERGSEEVRVLALGEIS